MQTVFRQLISDYFSECKTTSQSLCVSELIVIAISFSFDHQNLVIVRLMVLETGPMELINPQNNKKTQNKKKKQTSTAISSMARDFL